MSIYLFETENREPGTSSLFLILVKKSSLFQKCKSEIRKVSLFLFNYVGVYFCLGICLFHQHVRHAMLKKS